MNDEHPTCNNNLRLNFQNQRQLSGSQRFSYFLMIQTGLIQNAHGDLVTDASYDFYGLRLATCSLDQRSANFLVPYLAI